MPIIPHACPKHGQTTAYSYTTTKGRNKGKTTRMCRECRKEEVKRLWQVAKAGILKAYGSKCACCGETEPAFLTMDHTDGTGAQQRKQGLRGWRLYEWLAKRGYPKQGFRLLCYNCNCSRGQHGECPHKLKC